MASNTNQSIEPVFAPSTFSEVTRVYTYCGGWVDIDDWIKRLIKSVIIEEGVTEIAEKAGRSALFMNCTALTSITFPQSGTYVESGYRSLCGCRSLATLAVPDSCVDIEDLALLDFTSLKSFTFPNKCTKLNSNVLGFCVSLKTVKIPDCCVEIGDRSMLYCESLTTFAIPNACTQIHEDAFLGCTALQALADKANVSIEQYCRNRWRSSKLLIFKINLFASYNVLNRIRVNDPQLNDPLIDKSSILWAMYDRIPSDDVRRNIMEFLDYKWMGNK